MSCVEWYGGCFDIERGTSCPESACHGGTQTGGSTLPFPIPTQQPNQGSVVYPKSTATTTLDKILATALSTVALLTRQGSIPTAQQPYINPYAVNPYAAAYNREIPAGGGNTLGKLENWIKTHTLETALIAGAIVFYLLPSPRQTARR